MLKQKGAGDIAAIEAVTEWEYPTCITHPFWFCHMGVKDARQELYT